MGTKLKEFQHLSEGYTPPKAYGYGRVSHVTGMKLAESVPAQQDRIEQYYRLKLKESGVEWGGFHHDHKQVSAYRIPFRMRASGKELLKLLQPGDHLILDKVDRIWRSLHDFVNLMVDFRKRDISIHIVSFLGGTLENNAVGELMLKQLVLFAELDSQIKSERIKEALHIRKLRGQATSATSSWGCKRVDRMVNGKKTGFIVWDEKAREIGRILVRIIDDGQRTWIQSYDLIEKAIAELEGRPIRKIKDQMTDRKINWTRWHRQELAYQYLNIQHPSQIPSVPILVEAARQHRRVISERRNPGRKGLTKIEVITPEMLWDMENGRRAG